MQDGGQSCVEVGMCFATASKVQGCQVQERVLCPIHENCRKMPSPLTLSFTAFSPHLLFFFFSSSSGELDSKSCFKTTGLFLCVMLICQKQWENLKKSTYKVKDGNYHGNTMQYSLCNTVCSLWWAGLSMEWKAWMPFPPAPNIYYCHYWFYS